MGLKIYTTDIQKLKEIIDNSNTSKNAAVIDMDNSVKVGLKTFKELIKSIGDTIDLSDVAIIVNEQKHNNSRKIKP